MFQILLQCYGLYCLIKKIKEFIVNKYYLYKLKQIEKKESKEVEDEIERVFFD